MDLSSTSERLDTATSPIRATVPFLDLTQGPDDVFTSSSPIPIARTRDVHDAPSSSSNPLPNRSDMTTNISPLSPQSFVDIESAQAAIDASQPSSPPLVHLTTSVDTIVTPSPPRRRSQRNKSAVSPSTPSSLYFNTPLAAHEIPTPNRPTIPTLRSSHFGSTPVTPSKKATSITKTPAQNGSPPRTPQSKRTQSQQSTPWSTPLKPFKLPSGAIIETPTYLEHTPPKIRKLNMKRAKAAQAARERSLERHLKRLEGAPAPKKRKGKKAELALTNMGNASGGDAND